MTIQRENRLAKTFKNLDRQRPGRMPLRGLQGQVCRVKQHASRFTHSAPRARSSVFLGGICKRNEADPCFTQGGITASTSQRYSPRLVFPLVLYMQSVAGSALSSAGKLLSAVRVLRYSILQCARTQISIGLDFSRFTSHTQREICGLGETWLRLGSQLARSLTRVDDTCVG